MIKGIIEPHTFKIKGSIISLPLVALINSRASHNFLSEEAAFKLGFKRDKIYIYVCVWEMAGKIKRQVNGVCKVVTLSLGGVELLANFHAFPLGKWM